MGCVGSAPAKGDGNAKKIRKPKPWKHPQPITKSELEQMRDEFWDTAPHYGGQKGCFPYNLLPFRPEIWDALRAAAAEPDLSQAQVIVDCAGVIVQNTDLTICYDERGKQTLLHQICVGSAPAKGDAKYELPKYVLSEPTNMIRDN
ncbi:hypothetical protein GOBAR_DD08108 [Gossypium barbadense]|nr:hypothetical protein GOBAR_DD08108 [Gossypium barbadense]